MGNLLAVIRALKLWQIGVLGAVLLGGSAVAYAMANGGNEARLGPNQQLVPVQYGDLVNQVSINGSLVFPNKAALTFGVQGTVGDVLVQPGEYVEEGQPLARLAALTILSLEKSVAQAQIDLRKAEQALAKARASQGADVQKQAEFDAAAAAYRAAFNKWLGTALSDAELAQAPDVLLAAWGADLTVLFDPSQRFAGFNQAWLGSLPPNDPATPWNETVIYTWLNFAPTPIIVSCPEGDLPAGTNCIYRELDEAWTALESAREALDEALGDSELSALDVLLKEADLTFAQASLADARARLEGATLRAPIPGLVTAVNVAPGDSVTATTTVAQVIDHSVIEVNGIVDEIDVLYVRVGSQAIVTMDALGNRTLQGAISSIASEATTQQGVVTYPVRVRMNVPQGLELREGLSAVARVVLNAEQNVLLVPLQAVYGSFAQPVVRVASGSRIEERPVVLGSSDDFWVTVREGLAEGESVVMEGSGTTARTLPTTTRLQGGQLPGLGGGGQQFGPEQREQLMRQFQQQGGGGTGGAGGAGGGRGAGGGGGN